MSRDRLLPIFLFVLFLVISGTCPADARTTLGLSPHPDLVRKQDPYKALLKVVALKMGQPVTVRFLSDEKVSLDWLLRFREVEAVILSTAYFNEQQAGSLVPMVDLYTSREQSDPALILVAAPGSDPVHQDAWRHILVNIQEDPSTRSLLEDVGIDRVALRVAPGAPFKRAVGEAEQVARPSAPVAPVVSPVAPAVSKPERVEAPVVDTPEPPLPEERRNVDSVRKGSVAAVPVRTDLSVTEVNASVAAPEPVVAPSSAPSPVSSAELLSCDELVQRVIQLNPQVQMHRAQFGMKQAEEEGAWAIFEPDLVASVHLEDNSQRNTVEEALNRLYANVYEERNWDYNVSLEGLAPTGAQYNVGYTLRDLSNTVTRDLTGERDEQQMYLGISLTQPLLKNAGVDVTRSGIDVSIAETHASFHELRQELMDSAREAAKRYWNGYLAQEKLKLRQDSVRIADRILQDNRERVRTGKMAENEVLEAQAGVATRASLVSESEYESRESINRLRSLLSMKATQNASLRLSDSSSFNVSQALDRSGAMQRAFAFRPDYLSTKKRIEQADIRVAFAENQRWPELDLVASYGLNGLDFSRNDAWEQIEDADHASWSVGLEFRLPIQGGVDTRSELKRNMLEKKRLLWAMKDLEVTLTNDIDSAVYRVESAVRRHEYANRVVAIQRKLLDAEMMRLDYGKSHSRLVLEREDSHRVALEEALESRIRLETALVDLELTQGSILQKYDVEVLARGN